MDGLSRGSRRQLIQLPILSIEVATRRDDINDTIQDQTLLSEKIEEEKQNQRWLSDRRSRLWHTKGPEI